MPGAFLDTTIVVHAAEDAEPAKAEAIASIAAHPPAKVPYYAYRELLAGRIRILCEAHNKLHASGNAAEALLGLLRTSPAEGRKREARIQALSESLKEVFNSNPFGSRNDEKREMLQALMLRVGRLWKRSRSLKNVEAVQFLACFNDGKVSCGTAGELRGPGDSFNCRKQERCAAAAYLYDDTSSLVAMIDALHPSKLTPAAAKKNENSQRRKALKELHVRGPKTFSKNLCRALGDAYFAGMCPADSVVLTTNTLDFQPLCKAIGKALAK